MRALQLPPGKEWPVLGDTPKPTPRPSEVLLRVRASGICRTDIHLIHNARQEFERPVVLGHEIVGEIVSTGRSVATLQPGEIVLAHLKSCAGRAVHVPEGWRPSA
jgi:D-arabinose 1-dehydrogenase-like Zn-dependent alcohol dehydrogenase